jgi:hypothetical protein
LKVDNETLLFLLKGGHLNMPDRIARGLWPHAPLSFDTVANYLAIVLEQSDVGFHTDGNLTAPVSLFRRAEQASGNRLIDMSIAPVPTTPHLRRCLKPEKRYSPMLGALHSTT